MPVQQQTPQNGGSSDGAALTEQQRKRVSLILNSEAFQRELDEIIQSQVRSGAHPASLMALQQIADLLLPTARGGAGAGANHFGVAHNLPAPINDIRGSEVGHYCGGRFERQLRCKLAAVHRLMHIRGWADGFYSQAIARSNGSNSFLLVKPIGLDCREVTASGLSRLNPDGTVADPGGTVFGLAPTEPLVLALTEAVFANQPNSAALVLLQTPEVLAVANFKAGLLPLCSEAKQLGRVAVVPVDNADSVTKALTGVAASADALLLPGRCACLIGDTIEAAWRRAELLVAAACAQFETLRSAGYSDLASVPELAEPSAEDQSPTVLSQTDGNGAADRGGREWSFGQLEFEAAMRQLDAAGYKTGYDYLEPRVRLVKPGEVFMVLDQQQTDEATPGDGGRSGGGGGGARKARPSAGAVTSDSESERPHVGSHNDTVKSDVTSGGEDADNGERRPSDDHKTKKRGSGGGGFRIPSFSRGKKKESK